MRILVYGGTGYIGNNFVMNALENGHDLASVSRRKSIIQPVKNFRYDQSFSDVFEYFTPDAIIYFSACFNSNDLNNIIEINIKKPLEIANYLSTIKSKVVLLFIGSYWQFGDETHPNVPIDLYSASKKSMSNFIDYYAVYGFLNIKEVILHGIYGDNDNRGKIIDYMIDCTLQKKDIRLTKGEQNLNLSDVKDVCKELLSLLNSNEKIYKYEIKSETDYSLRELAEYFNNKYLAKIDLGYFEYRDVEIFKATSANNYKKIIVVDNLMNYIDDKLKKHHVNL